MLCNVFVDNLLQRCFKCHLLCLHNWHPPFWAADLMGLLCRELVWEILYLCSWSSLMTLNRTNRCLHSFIQEFLCSRVRIYMTNFLCVNSAVTLFGLLDVCKGLVIGPIVWCIMSVDEDVYRHFNPRQMDIIAPSCQRTSFIEEFLVSNNYFLDCSGRVDPAFSTGYKSYKTYENVH